MPVMNGKYREFATWLSEGGPTVIKLPSSKSE